MKIPFVLLLFLIGLVECYRWSTSEATYLYNQKPMDFVSASRYCKSLNMSLVYFDKVSDYDELWNVTLTKVWTDVHKTYEPTTNKKEWYSHGSLLEWYTQGNEECAAIGEEYLESCSCDGLLPVVCRASYCEGRDGFYSHLDSRSCYGRGYCSFNNYCVCDDYYYGDSCEYDKRGVHCNGIIETNPHVCNGRGQCISQDLCECNANYTGQYCQDPICFGYGSEDERSCMTPSGESGYCVAPNVCECMSHKTRYGGENCSVPLCGSSGICSNGGHCIGPDQCECQDGYFGETCSEFSCFGKSAGGDVCSGHGECTSLDQCECHAHWSGEKCDVPYCGFVDDCGPHGVCTAPFRCECKEGYYGSDCSQFKCFGYDQYDSTVCNGAGNCTSLDNCICEKGHSGYNCSDYQCYGIDSMEEGVVCNGHGKCISFDNCKCHSEYSGSDCSIPVCFGKYGDQACNQTGVCIAPDQCLCQDGHGGEQCNMFYCFNQTGSMACSGNGECVNHDECKCYPGFKSRDCSEIVIVKSRGLLTVPIGQGTCSGNGQCSGHGTCTNSKCVCNAGYGDSYCDKQVCGTKTKDDRDVCGGENRGICGNGGICSCTSGNSGTFCDQFSCTVSPDGETCYGRGICVYSGMCNCDEPYAGSDCASEPKCAYRSGISTNDDTVAQTEIDRLNTDFYDKVSGTGYKSCTFIKPFMLVRSRDLFDNYGRCNFDFDPELLKANVHDSEKLLAYTLISSDTNSIDSMCPGQSAELRTDFLRPYDYSHYSGGGGGGYGNMVDRRACLVNLGYTEDDMKTDQYKFNSIESAIKYCAMDSYANVVVNVPLKRGDIPIQISSATVTKNLYLEKVVILKKRMIGSGISEYDIDIILDDGVYNENINAGSNFVASSTDSSCSGSGYRSIRIRAKNTGKVTINGVVNVASALNTLSIVGVNINPPRDTAWFQNSAVLYNFAMSYSSIKCNLTSPMTTPPKFKVARKGLPTPTWMKEYSDDGFLLYSSNFEKCNGIFVELFEENVQCGDVHQPFSIQYMKNKHINNIGIILSIHTLERTGTDTGGSRRIDYVNIANNAMNGYGEYKTVAFSSISALYSIYMANAEKWISPSVYGEYCTIATYICKRRLNSIYQLVFSGNLVSEATITPFAAVEYIAISTSIQSNDMTVTKLFTSLVDNRLSERYARAIIAIWSNPEPSSSQQIEYTSEIVISNNKFNTTGFPISYNTLSFSDVVYDLVRIGNLHVTGYSFPAYYDTTTSSIFNGYINTDGSWYYPPYKNQYSYSIKKLKITGNYCMTINDPLKHYCSYRSGFNITTTHGEHARFVYYESYNTLSLENTDTGIQSIPYSYMLKNGRSMTGLVYDFYFHSTALIPSQFESLFGQKVRCNITCKGSCNACLVDDIGVPSGGLYGSVPPVIQYCFDVVVFSAIGRGSSMCAHNTLQLAPGAYDPTTITFSASPTMYIEPYRTDQTPNARATIKYSDSPITYAPETTDHPIQFGSSVIQFKNIDFVLIKGNSNSIYRQALFYVGPVIYSVVNSVSFINCTIYGNPGYSMSVMDDSTSSTLLRELYIIDTVISGFSWSGVIGATYKFESIRSKYYNMGSGAISTKASARLIIESNEMYAVTHSVNEGAVIYSEACKCTLGCSIKNNTIVGLLGYIKLAKDKVAYDYFSSPSLIYLKGGYMKQDQITYNSYYGSQIGLKYHNMMVLPCDKDQLRAMRILNPVISGTKADLACSGDFEFHCSGFCMNRTIPPSVCVIDPNADTESADYGYNIFLDFEEAIYGCTTSGTMYLVVKPGIYDQTSDILAFTTSTQTSLDVRVDGPCGSVSIIASGITIDATLFYGTIHIECINFYYYKNTASSSSSSRNFFSIESIGTSPNIHIDRCKFASELTLYNMDISSLKPLVGTYQAPMVLLNINCYSSSLTALVYLNNVLFDTAWDYGATISTNILTMQHVTMRNIAEAALKIENVHNLVLDSFVCNYYCGLWSSSNNRLALTEISIYQKQGDTYFQVTNLNITLTDITYQDKNPSPVRYSGLKLGFVSSALPSSTGTTINWKGITVVDYPIAIRIDSTITKSYVLLNEPSDWIPLYDDSKRYMRELMVINGGVDHIAGTYADVRHSSYSQDTVLGSDYTCNDLCPSDEVVSCSVNKDYTPSTVGYGQIFFSTIQSAVYNCIRSPRIVRLVYMDQTAMNNQDANLVHEEVAEIDLTHPKVKSATITIKGQANIFYPNYNITWKGGIKFTKSDTTITSSRANIRIMEYLNLVSSCDSFMIDPSSVRDSSIITVENLMFTRDDCPSGITKPLVKLESLFSSILFINIYVRLKEETARVIGTRFMWIDGGCISLVTMETLQIDADFYKTSNMIAVRSVKSFILTNAQVTGCSFGSSGIEETFTDADMFSCVHSSLCQDGSFDIGRNSIVLKALDTTKVGDLMPYHEKSSNAYSCMSIEFVSGIYASVGDELSEDLYSNACSGKPPLGIKLINYIMPSSTSGFPSNDIKYYVRNASLNNAGIDAHRFDVIVNSASVKDKNVHQNDLLYSSYNCLDTCSAAERLPEIPIIFGVTGGVAGILLFLWVISIFTERSVLGIICCDAYNSKSMKERYEENRPSKKTIVVPMNQNLLRKRLKQIGYQNQ